LPAAGERLANAQAEAFRELGNRLRPHREAVAFGEPRERLWVRLDRAAQPHKLLEEALETGRRDDLEDPARLVAGVPERVPLVARLEDETAWTSFDHFLAQKRAHPPLQDEAVLVFARVQMQGRGERTWRHRMLDEREPLGCLVAVDHEAHADAAEEAFA